MPAHPRGAAASGLVDDAIEFVIALALKQKAVAADRGENLPIAIVSAEFERLARAGVVSWRSPASR